MNRSLFTFNFLLLITLSIGCQNASQNESIESQKSTGIVKEKSETEKKVEQSIYKTINNDFASTPFGSRIGTEYLKSYNVDFSRISKEIQNKHSDAIDSILTFKYKESYFEFYKTSDTRIFLRNVQISNKEIKVGDLSLGMSKSDFLDILGLDSVKESTILVTDEEEYSWHIFKFGSDGLSEITLNHNVD